MEPNIEEALQAKANAERKFAERDFVGAKNYALKAQMLCPQLEGISQMVATFGVHSAAEMKVNGEFDFYTILGMDPSANRAKLKKQYKRMAVLLHPDKNRSIGADGAFRLVSEAWTVLSDRAKRSSYDQRRSLFTLHTSGVGNYGNYSNSSASQSRLDTFWTVCTSCQVQYEYLRKYVNKRLSCKNCRGVFIAVETGLAPVNGSYAFSPWPYAPENGYKSHGRGVTYVPTSPPYSANNGLAGHHSKHGSEHISNLSFQWSSFPGTSAGVLDPNGSSTAFSLTQQASMKASGRKANGKQELIKMVTGVVANGSVSSDQLPRRPGRPPKKRKIDVESTSSYVNGEVAPKASAEVIMADGNGNENLKRNVKLPAPDVSIRRWSAAPAFDARRLLIDKARTDIRKKLEEIRLTSEAAAAEAEKEGKAHAQFGESSERPKIAGLGVAAHQSDMRKSGSMIMTVPDSDFHDFDKDRSEDCFKPKQIWALYDEEDGMPRLYCLIRQVISVQPFKIHISYLSSKTDTEFGLVNWLDSGFTKSCGKFRAFNSEIVEQVNIFSHLLSREKAGRGGCVQIYPKSGDIWAIYRNWSTNWNRRTPDEVRHQYEMVEVLGDYSEDFGVCVAPLVKLDGFKTVYQRNTNKDAIRKIPRREMLRFSHQVPSRLLKGETMNLPEGCWELDPAATPDDLLQGVSDVQEERPIQAERRMLVEENLRQLEHSAVSDMFDGATTPGSQIQENSNEQKTLFRPSTELPQSVRQIHTYEEPSKVDNLNATPGEHLRAVMNE
ncbi:uncharacterized protein LOC107829380 [Nicotiana tabacum]|uniref:J domain-containing protein n=1 Tax=Nicotiana tabacum TaxID=4097 RepID=A0A1S4DGE4_TOBAC|nr:PREDICTED: uncharacterized protein LOC107829380 [Nicotiana tabacum]XP_016512335.1 PREDICTED: uncharacterized protein LOC107829380 [Nicotiana tabacum]